MPGAEWHIGLAMIGCIKDAPLLLQVQQHLATIVRRGRCILSIHSIRFDARDMSWASFGNYALPSSISCLVRVPVEGELHIHSGMCVLHHTIGWLNDAHLDSQLESVANTQFFIFSLCSIILSHLLSHPMETFEQFIIRKNFWSSGIKKKWGPAGLFVLCFFHNLLPLYFVTQGLFLFLAGLV